MSEQRTLQDYSQSEEGGVCSQANLNCLGVWCVHLSPNPQSGELTISRLFWFRWRSLLMGYQAFLTVQVLLQGRVIKYLFAMFAFEHNGISYIAEGIFWNLFFFSALRTGNTGRTSNQPCIAFCLALVYGRNYQDNGRCANVCFTAIEGSWK